MSCQKLKPEDYRQRCWIDIDLDKIRQNYRTACSLTKAKVYCVLKANAYGHGAIRVAQALQDAGCRSFAVSCGREALALRKNGIRGEILVMGAPEPAQIGRLIAEGVSLTAASFDDLRHYEQCAVASGTDAIVHIKLDTGFHRLGFACEEEALHHLAEGIRGCSHIRFDGLFSHLGLIDREHDEKQHCVFAHAIAVLQSEGITFPCVHLGDSIGLVRYPDWHYDAVRAGAFLFGVRPSRSDHMPFEDPETLVFQAQITQIRDVAAGEVIGYGDEQIFDHPVRVATVSTGYGDGYPRRLSYGQGKVLIRGKLCGTVGLICMDQMMVDVSAQPEAAVGDEVTLLGGGISYMTYCDWAHTNRNECITALTSRPPRVYYENNRSVTVVDEMLQERIDC